MFYYCVLRLIHVCWLLLRTWFGEQSETVLLRVRRLRFLLRDARSEKRGITIVCRPSVCL